MSERIPQLLFYLLASATIGSAIVTITRRELVSAAISLIATFFCLSGVYLLLHAPFLAVLQLLVYAGAIMTLFVFVVMMLGREERDPWVARGLVARGVAAAALLFLVARVGYAMLRHTEVADRAVAKADNLPDSFGSVVSVGRVLFGEQLLPFEVVSIVLLVAVVGVLLVAGARRLPPDAVVVSPSPAHGADEHGTASHDAGVEAQSLVAHRIAASDGHGPTATATPGAH